MRSRFHLLERVASARWPVAVLCVSCVTLAADPIVIDLWPGAVPGDVGIAATETSRIHQSPLVGPTKLISNVTQPTLTVYRAAGEGPSAAMVICPGGGYHNLYWELEGEEVAAWLNSIGITGIILKYRVPRRSNDDRRQPPLGPLLDAQRAVSVVRSRATEWGADPKRIGMIGFSMGAHLAIATATSFERRRYERVDDRDEASCRPDFAIVCYPDWLTGARYGKSPDELSPAFHIPASTPPILLVHASDDTMAPADNSAVMYLALKRAGVPAELHVFATGEHDFGVRRNDKLPSNWTQLCVAWLRAFHYLSPQP